MPREKKLSSAALCLSASLLLSCGSHDSGTQRLESGAQYAEKVLNLNQSASRGIRVVST